MADLIDRQAAVDAIENTDCELSSDAWDELTDAIMSLPSAQPEQKTGRWIGDSLVCISGYSYGVLRCSICEAYYEKIGFWPHRYCPNCGAKMDGSDE